MCGIQKELSQSAFEASLGDVVCDRSPKLRDEAPAAYKDLSEVMDNQVRLWPRAANVASSECH